MGLSHICGRCALEVFCFLLQSSFQLQFDEVAWDYPKISTCWQKMILHPNANCVGEYDELDGMVDCTAYTAAWTIMSRSS